MKQHNFDYLSSHKSKNFPDPKVRITYSFNNVENTITGHLEEEGNQICLYEYRGKYVGTEFLISFSKDSISYKLIHVDDEQNELIN